MSEQSAAGPVTVGPVTVGPLSVGPASVGPASVGPVTLGIDIGGTNLKAGLLDADGKMLGERVRVPTPHEALPAKVVELLVTLVRPLGTFSRVSVGFPGVVRQGVVMTAPNLGTQHWVNFALADTLARTLGQPVRMLNDATVQGLGVIGGQGLECVITLGTGFGFALYQDGRLAPHLEMGQHIARRSLTYDLYVGDAARNELGKKRWLRRVDRTIKALRVLTNFDTLYVGGGNARLIKAVMPADIRLISNEAGITGGVKLWAAALDDAFAGAPRAEGTDRPV